MSAPEYQMAADPMDPQWLTQAPTRDQQGMTEEELLAIVSEELASAAGYIESTAELRRARLLRRYDGEPYGNEVEGYSKVVDRSVYEVVEWALPQLVETFLAGDQVARFDPVGPEDEDEAMQQTDLANHVFLKENNGFLILSTAIKDALIQEIGIIHWYWKDETRVEHEFYEGQTEQQVTAYMIANPEMKITGAAPSQVAPGLWDVELARTFPGGRLCIDAIPPEEFLYSEDARSVEDARLVGRKRTITASEMIDMGYPRELVDELKGDGGLPTTSGELARIERDGSPGSMPRNTRHDSERGIDLAELWIRVDFDGDGISELRRVVVASDGRSVSKLISHEPAPRKPFAVASPILRPHRINGTSLAETVEDLEEQSTQMMRAFLNGLYLWQRPRMVVLGNPDGTMQADMSELMSVVPGGVVTEYVSGAIRPLIEKDITPQSIAGLELMKGKREERTGITRTYQGVEAPHGLNDTATGMQMLKNAAGMRLAFIARLIAENMVKPTFTGIAAELKQHQRVPKAIRLRGKWVDVDPTNWRNDYDATVEVGLGYGDQNQAMYGIQQIMAIQEKLLTSGAYSNMVQQQDVWESLREFCKSLGFKNAERFFTDPETNPPQDPGPSPDEQKLMVESELKKRELDLRELEMRLNHEAKMRELGIKEANPHPDPVGDGGRAAATGEQPEAEAA